MTLPRVLVALMLLPATAAAQHDGAREGLVITPRGFGEEVAESRHTGRLAQAAEDAPRTDGPNVSVHVYGGWRQLWGGDVNEAAANTFQRGLSLWYEALVPLQDGDAPAIRRGPEYGADVTVHLTPRFGLVGGVGWIESSSTGRLIEVPHSTLLWPMRQSDDLTMRSVPVRFGARYTHPISRRLSLVADGGTGLYFTNLQWSRRAEVDIFSTRLSGESIWDVRGYDIGFHGGVSLDVSVSDGIGLVFGVQGVHANIGGLDGHRDTTSIRYGLREEIRRTDGTLGVFERDDSISPILGLVEDEPRLDQSLSPIRSVKEASVGLGGLRYTVGLRVSFADKTTRLADARSTRDLQETATATSPSRDWHRVSVRLSGGRRWLRGGDVNDGVDAWAQVFESYLDNEVVGLQPGDGGDVAALRRGASFAVDVLVHLTSRVAIVAGVGRVESSSAGTIENPVAYGGFESATRNSTSLGARAIPIRVGAQYSFSLGRRVSLGVEGGVGLYFTDLSWSHVLDVSGRISRWDSETRGQDLGLHGGVWVDVGISDRFGLVFGAEGASANVSGLSGFREGTFSYREPVRDDGTLSFAEATQLLIVGNGSWLDERYGPITPGRDASLGLGGLRLSAGLRIGL